MSEYSCAIVGMRFRPPAQGVLDALAQGFPLVLRREPGNVHDANAIGVHIGTTENEREMFEGLDEQLVNEKLAGFGCSRDDALARMPMQLGYIPKEDAAMIAPKADQIGLVTWRGVLSFSPEGKPRISFSVEEETEDETEEDDEYGYDDEDVEEG